MHLSPRSIDIELSYLKKIGFVSKRKTDRKDTFGMWIKLSAEKVVNTDLMADVRKDVGVKGETVVSVLWIGLPRWNKFNEPVLEHSEYSGEEAEALWAGLTGTIKTIRKSV